MGVAKKFFRRGKTHHHWRSQGVAKVTKSLSGRIFFEEKCVFKAKMHRIRFPLGFRSRPRWGSLQRSPGPLAVFEGPTSKGRGVKGGEMGKQRTENGLREMREGREGKWKYSCRAPIFLWPLPLGATYANARHLPPSVFASAQFRSGALFSCI